MLKLVFRNAEWPFFPNYKERVSIKLLIFLEFFKKGVAKLPKLAWNSFCRASGLELVKILNPPSGLLGSQTNPVQFS